MLRHMFQNRFVQIAALAAVISVASGLYYFKVSGYTNPGPLSDIRGGSEMGGFASHAMFEQECTHCHGPIHCVIPENCQDCHFEIAGERMEATSLHGKLPAGEKCAVCHVEHQGNDATLIAMPLPNIDHMALSGFALDGHEVDYSGEEMICESCHVGGQFSAEFVECTTCHEANDTSYMGSHMAEFGYTCISCHDGLGSYQDFEHSARFALEGGHADLTCETCHAELVQRITGEACGACHEEPDLHVGQFGQQCDRCHVITAWAPAQLQKHTFARTHGNDDVSIPCETCHSTTYTAYTCAGCHEHEPELARAQHPAMDAAELTDCASCHPTGDSADVEPLHLAIDDHNGSQVQGNANGNPTQNGENGNSNRGGGNGSSSQGQATGGGRR
ncbi:MAG: cytochrome c3 family protein [Anaerolineae bacterium]|nr:cytochrome c3 family protein [Anaerolineae bacterium]MCO5197267.1 cytochrome c3 family protein [Anaerolineae bacterium]MCO5204795.1 cytochrome c3 family protein [Anaerolineae bacterium]